MLAHAVSINTQDMEQSLGWKMLMQHGAVKLTQEETTTIKGSAPQPPVVPTDLMHSIETSAKMYKEAFDAVQAAEGVG